jgi:ADP-heptose:LPS heptosyltransferase
VIHAGTARPEKYWVASRWAEVAGTLASTYDLEIVLTGSTDPAETSHVSDIIQALDSGVSARNLCGKTRLPALAAVIAGAKVFCGVDTAAMHMAEAVRTPCLALFGPTNPYHWRPRVTKNAVLRSRTAAPFGPAQKGGRMEELPAPRVIEALHGLLNSQL